MKYREMNAGATADMLENVAALLAGPGLTAINAAVRTEFLAAIGSLPADLTAAAAEALVKHEEAIASTTVRNSIKMQADTILGQVAANLRGGLASKEQFDLCGFRYPFASRPRVIPNAPDSLSAIGASNGIIQLRFRGNNKYGQCQYEIWRREGIDGEWMLLAPTGKQSFRDESLVPGRYCEYKVRAKAATATSAFSGIATVYGVA